jgi:hypothetical protein
MTKDPTDVRVLRATCTESENGFRVHLTDADWDGLVKDVRQLQAELAEEREHSANLQRGFDDPDGGPLARALARSLYHLEQQRCRKLYALLKEAYAELSTVEAITVSPTDVDGLIDLLRRMKTALEEP